MPDTTSYPPATPTRHRSRRTDPVPAAVTLVVGALLLVVATLVCDLLNLPLTQSLAISAVIAAAACFRARLQAAAYVGVMAFALFNAFVEDREGLLGFHGRDDLLRLTVLVLVPCAAAAVTRVVGRAGSA
jgi:K+-sensing histidine kinase KdpD